jgi:hypothetical protein
MNDYKRVYWLSVLFLVIGIGFFVWGGVIYHQYPGLREARHIIRMATRTATAQYALGFLFLIGSYFTFKILK